MADRASTNIKALKYINQQINDENPKRNDCISHTLNNCAQEMTKNNKASHCSLFRKCYQRIIQHPGKARDLAKVLFKGEVKDAGGVRFFRHYEQIVQISEFGLDVVLKEMVKPCFRNKWSEESSKNLLLQFDGTINLAKLAMAMVESVEIVDSARYLCTACYTLEGDSPLVLTAYEVLMKVDNVLISNEPSLPSVENISSKASAMIKKAHLSMKIKL